MKFFLFKKKNYFFLFKMEEELIDFNEEFIKALNKFIYDPFEEQMIKEMGYNFLSDIEELKMNQKTFSQILKKLKMTQIVKMKMKQNLPILVMMVKNILKEKKWLHKQKFMK